MARKTAKPPISDRIVGFFSPKTALARIAARQQAGVLARSYDAARPGSQDDGWLKWGAAASPVDMLADLPRLRGRSRHACRNNAHAKRAVELITSYDIGTGIVPVSASGAAAVDKARDAAWKLWAERPGICDFEGQLDIYGLQALIRRTIAESGECLIRKWAAPGTAPVGLRLQVLEPDYLDSTRDQICVEKDGAYTRGGIMFDRNHQRIGYWLYQVHPGDYGFGLQNPVSSLIPANDVIHAYRKTRPGQIRGVPEMHAVLSDLDDEREYHEAEMIRGKAQSMITWWVRNASGDTSARMGIEGHEGPRRIERVRPGQVLYLDGSEEVTPSTPTGMTVLDTFTRLALQRVAAGCGIPYADLSGDPSQANYSSQRAAIIQLKRFVEQTHELMVRPMILAPLWQSFCEYGALSGLWPAGVDPHAAWTPPAFSMVDPEKDSNALITQVRAGLISWDDAVRMCGGDPDDMVRVIKARNAAWDKAEVVLTVDPRRLSDAGQAANPSPAPGEEPPPPPKVVMMPPGKDAPPPPSAADDAEKPAKADKSAE
jgi:lambda family phage portal protein